MNLALILQISLFVLLMAEIIIPSGGVLFAVSAAVLIWSWIEIIQSGSQDLFIIYGLADIIGIPLLLWYSIKVLETSKFSLQSNLAEEDGYQVQAEWTVDLRGERGIVTQDLRPVGKVKIADKEFEALSQNDWIESGSKIEVISSDENKIIVKKFSKKFQ